MSREGGRAEVGQELAQANETLLEFKRLIQTGGCSAWEGTLRTGVDLGTANIVLAVVDEQNRPVAEASYPSTVVRDGIMVDYMGAVRAVTHLKGQLEERLGVMLGAGACAIPPDILEGNVKAVGDVVEATGFRLTDIVDEPAATSSVLGISDGAVVGVGGGTTDISVLKDGKVILTGNEPTRGTHMTLVLAGFRGWNTQEAELAKQGPAQEADVFSVIKPVVEKMASIIRNYLREYPVEAVYVVSGVCCFTQFESVFGKFLDIPVVKPAAPLLVTPLRIAVNYKL